MAVYKVSLEELLKRCELANLPGRFRFYWEAPEHEWVHNVPRLMVYLEGAVDFEYFRGGQVVLENMPAPLAIFCTRGGMLHSNEEDSHSSCKALSFSYFPGHIRAMFIDYDGVHRPPTERDIYYHTREPLSVAGMAVVAALERLVEEGREEAASALCRVLWELTLDALRHSTAAPVVPGHRLWEQMAAYLREHREEAVSRSELARIFSLSPGYVSALCRRYTGGTFQELQLRYRLEHAAHLLLNTRLGLEEVAERSGFSGANYFIRQFKRRYGMTPHVYRNRTGQ